MSRNHRALPSSAWARARRQVLRPGVVCWLCGGPLDFDAPARSAMAPSVDHTVPMAALAELSAAERQRVSLDVRLLRPAHYGCNSRRGARRARPMGERAW